MEPATPTPEADESPIFVATRRIPAEDPLTVLASLPEGARFAWLGPDEVVIAQGAAARLEASGPDRFEVIHRAAEALWDRLRPADGPGASTSKAATWHDPAGVPPRLVGGFSFHPEPTRDAPWDGFPAALFVLPERLWVWQDGACHLVEATTTEPPPAPVEGPPAPRMHDMQQPEWEEAVAELVTRIRAGNVKKVVLARSRRLPAVDPVLLLRVLPEEKGTYRFLFEVRPGRAFVGATPEHLVTLTRDRVETVALAGTAPRGRDDPQDEEFAQRLVANPKDNVEHALIVAWLDERLTGAGATDLNYGPRRVRKLRHVQHLETLVLAQAKAGTHVLRLVDALHPTPAVGGLPVDEAYRLVRRLEESPRGWYAGGVGFFTPSGEGTFVTAIRTGLATREGLHAYAGAGIVAGSHPTREWEETQWKLRLVEEASRLADPDRAEEE